MKKITGKRIINRLRRLFRRCFYYPIEDIVFKKVLDSEVYRIKNKTIRAVEGTRQQMDEFLTRNHQSREIRTIVNSFFENNFRVTLAYVGDEVIGYVWWTDRHHACPASQHPHIHRYNIELGEKDVWGFSLDILPQYRGNNTASDFFQQFRKQLRDAGYSTFWGFAQKDNLPALWLHKMQRFEQVKTIKSVLWFGHWLYVDLDGGRWYVKNGPGSRQKFDYAFLRLSGQFDA